MKSVNDDDGDEDDGDGVVVSGGGDMLAYIAAQNQYYT